MPQEAEHAEGVYLTWILVLQLNCGIKPKHRALKGCHPVPHGMQSRWSGGEEAALVLIGVVAPAAPWCSLTPEPPAQRNSAVAGGGAAQPAWVTFQQWLHHEGS